MMPMTAWFWLDLTALFLAATVSTALMMMVLGTGLRNPLSRAFALFTAESAIWAVTALALRISLWLGVGNPDFLLELTAVELATLSILLLLFTARYTNMETGATKVAIAVASLIILLSLPPLFRHQLFYSPSLTPNGVIVNEISTGGMLVAVIPVALIVWSLFAFGQARKRLGEPYLAISVAILFLGLILGGLMDISVPILSFADLISVSVLGYGVVRRQLFNPLRELTQDLEGKVEERTQELARAAAELEKANLALSRRSKQLEAAAQVARNAAAIRDLRQLLDVTVRLISDRFGFYHAGIFLVDDAREYAVLRAASSEGGQRMLKRGHKLRVGEVGIVGYVAGTGKPRIALDVGEDAVFFNNPDLPMTRSEMGLPLVMHGEVIGVLDVQSTEPGAFSDEDVAILQTMADQVALAIENARLLAEAEARLQEMNILLGRYSRAGWEELAAGRTGWGYVYDGLEVLPRQAVEDTTDIQREARLTVPLQVRGTTVGRLALLMREGTPSPEAVALAQTVAEQAGLALENARLFLQTQQALGEAEALYRASRAIGAATTPDDVEEALIEYASEGGADAVRLLSVEKDRQGRPVRARLGKGWRSDERPMQPEGMRLTLADYPLSSLLASQETVVIKDVENDSSVNPPLLTLLRDGLGVMSCTLVPISTAEEWLGVLFVGFRETDGVRDVMVRGCETLAGQAAVALESMRLLEETQRRAERERLIAEVTRSFRETLDVETVLQTAAREIGERLNLSELIVRVGVDEQVDRGDD